MKGRNARTVYGCASVLLSYPGEPAYPADLAAVEQATARLPDGPARTHLQRCTTWLRSMAPLAAAAAYVEVFDNRRRRGLYLTYYRHGDTRERGMALAALAGAYRQAGFVIQPGELPDFLPALLELAASTQAGEALLSEHRAAVEVLQAELEEAKSPYAWPVAAVSAALGPLDRAGRALLERYRERGTPTEDVGLEPFAPPEAVAPTDDLLSATTGIYSAR